MTHLVNVDSLVKAKALRTVRFEPVIDLSGVDGELVFDSATGRLKLEDLVDEGALRDLLGR